MSSRVKVGSGWKAMRDITVAGDLNHDGHADVSGTGWNWMNIIA